MVSATPRTHTIHIIFALGASALMHLGGLAWSAHRAHRNYAADTTAHLFAVRIQNPSGQATRPPSQTKTARHETSPRPQHPQPLPSGGVRIPSRVTPERAAIPFAPSIDPHESVAPTTEPTIPKAFGPLISRPIGQGEWGRSSRPPDTETLMAPEQQSMALRSLLQSRLAAMGEIMRMNEQSFTCLIRVDLQARRGQVTCNPTSFEPVTWSALQALITAGDTPDLDRASCIMWTAFEVLHTDCQHLSLPPGPAPAPDMESGTAPSATRS